MSPKITTMKSETDDGIRQEFTCPGCGNPIMNGDPCYNKVVNFSEVVNGREIECTKHEVWCMDCKGKELEARSKD